MFIDPVSPRVRGLHVVFWGRAPIDNPTAEYEWRYVACEDLETSRQIYQQLRDQLKPGYQLNMVDTGDLSSPLLPSAVERGIFEQRSVHKCCPACGK